MIEAALPDSFAPIERRFSEIFVVVSPPRCSSTAFARVLWEQPSIRFYSHEPFEVTYYDDAPLDTVIEKLESPLDLSSIKAAETEPGAAALVIKEMPYQVGDRFPLLAALASKPIVFLMRDPRLNIASRIEKKLEVGADPNYPFIESGWSLLAEQIAYCRDQDIDFMLVDSTDFRNRPQAVFPEIFERLGLPFSLDSLSWRPTQVDIDNLRGKHRHLYRRVLESSGIQPADEGVPPLEMFPEEGGWRQHAEACLATYEDLGAADERVG